MVSFDQDFALGRQAVCLTTDPSRRPGHIVAIMLRAPYLALVRWAGAEATFEALDDLVDAA